MAFASSAKTVTLRRSFTRALLQATSPPGSLRLPRPSLQRAQYHLERRFAPDESSAVPVASLVSWPEREY